jgi:hypothetical protein
MIFEPMVPQDFNLYRPFFENQRYPLCAYALSSIIAWSNEEYKPVGTEFDGALIVGAEFKKMKKNRHLILPISPQKEFSPDELASLAKRTAFNQFWFVPETYVGRYGQEEVENHFQVMSHAAYDDYVYRVEDLAELKGNRYSKKRNLIKQFRRNFVDQGRVEIEPIDKTNADACLSFLEEWCRERDCDADDQLDLSCEKIAAINTIEHIDTFDVTGICLTLDGKVSAFGISAPLTKDMATLQYEKAFSSVKGLYQYFDNACARMLFNSYTYLNKESDMGIPGLAKAKRSYHPVKMEKSVKLLLKR